MYKEPLNGFCFLKLPASWHQSLNIFTTSQDEKSLHQQAGINLFNRKIFTPASCGYIFKPASWH